MPALLGESLCEDYKGIKEASKTCLEKGWTNIMNYKKM